MENQKKTISVIAPLIGIVCYLIVMLLLSMLIYGRPAGAQSFLQVLLPLGIIGVIPMIFTRYTKGMIFLAGVAMGYLAEAVSGSQMKGFSFAIFVFLGVIVGGIVEAIQVFQHGSFGFRR